MGDKEPLVPFYHGHASLMSLVPPDTCLIALAALAVAIAVVWSRRPKKRDTDRTE